MEDSYRTLERPAEGLFRDRNSRFLAFGFPVHHVEEIEEILTDIRKRYHDARHHCYAYRMGVEKEIYRMNDDGEPSGTAGKPIYNQLLAEHLTHVLVIVVRYFGGTLLGTGGLINAYKSATRDMLSHASLINKYVVEDLQLTFPYEQLSAVMKIFKAEDLVPMQPVYDIQCTVHTEIKKSQSIRLMAMLKDIPGLILETSKMND